MRLGSRNLPPQLPIVRSGRSDYVSCRLAWDQRGFTSKRTGVDLAITVPGALLLNISSDAL